MASNYVGPHAGEPGDVDSTQRNPLGTVIKGDDGSEFVYMLGVASTAAGDWVTYDENFATTRLVANAVGQVAVASAATVADKYGWYCVKSPRGGYSALGEALSADLCLYIDATTTGAVDDASVAGDFIFNAYSRSAITGAGQFTAEFDHPFVTNVLS